MSTMTKTDVSFNCTVPFIICEWLYLPSRQHTPTRCNIVGLNEKLSRRPCFCVLVHPSQLLQPRSAQQSAPPVQICFENPSPHFTNSKCSLLKAIIPISPFWSIQCLCGQWPSFILVCDWWLLPSPQCHDSDALNNFWGKVGQKKEKLGCELFFFFLREGGLHRDVWSLALALRHVTNHSGTGGNVNAVTNLTLYGWNGEQRQLRWNLPQGLGS